ncbi:MAG: hypothetical protein AB7K67_01735 [Hyphomicrobiaceae bacterium]
MFIRVLLPRRRRALSGLIAYDVLRAGVAARGMRSSLPATLPPVVILKSKKSSAPRICPLRSDLAESGRSRSARQRVDRNPSPLCFRDPRSGHILLIRGRSTAIAAPNRDVVRAVARADFSVAASTFFHAAALDRDGSRPTPTILRRKLTYF